MHQNQKPQYENKNIDQSQRGILFCGGEHPDIAQALRFIGPYRISVAADSGFETALKQGIIPDYLIGDLDSISDFSLLQRIPQDRIISYSPEKDSTDTELALDLLKSHKITEPILIGGSGGRLDHLFALKKLYNQDYFPRVWIAKESLIIACGQTEMSCSISNLFPNDPISIFPVGLETHKIQATNLFWPIDKLNWDGGDYSLSNKTLHNNIKLTVSGGLFLICLPFLEHIHIKIS